MMSDLNDSKEKAAGRDHIIIEEQNENRTSMMRSPSQKGEKSSP